MGSLASVRVRGMSELLQGRVHAALMRRWSSMLECTAARPHASTVTSCEGWQEQVLPGHEALLCLRWRLWDCDVTLFSAVVSKEKREKRLLETLKAAQALKVADESERESVSKIVAATVREILGEPEPHVPVRTLPGNDARSKTMGRVFWQVVDHVSCSWQLVMSRDGPVLMV